MRIKNRTLKKQKEKQEDYEMECDQMLLKQQLLEQQNNKHKMVKSGGSTAIPFNYKINKERGILHVNYNTLICIGCQGYSYNENANLSIKQSIETNYGGGYGNAN